MMTWPEQLALEDYGAIYLHKRGLYRLATAALSVERRPDVQARLKIIEKGLPNNLEILRLKKSLQIEIVFFSGVPKIWNPSTERNINISINIGFQNSIGYLIYINKHTKIILTDINELLIYLDGI